MTTIVNLKYDLTVFGAALDLLDEETDGYDYDVNDTPDDAYEMNIDTANWE